MIEMKSEKWTANNIGDSGARMISEVLKRNSTLTILDLGGDENEEWIYNENRDKVIEMKIEKWTGSKIGDEGARMISEGLKSNSSLTELNLLGDENEE